MSVQPPGAAVTMLVVDAARLMRRRFEAELAKSDTGLTAGAARTLFYVWTNPGLRQAALAEKMYVEPMTLVGYLDNLEKAGLIRRCPDPKDGRAKVIELLPASRQRTGSDQHGTSDGPHLGAQRHSRRTAA